MPEYTPSEKLRIEYNSGPKGTRKGQRKTRTHVPAIPKPQSTPVASTSTAAQDNQPVPPEYDIHMIEVQPEDAQRGASSKSVRSKLYIPY